MQTVTLASAQEDAESKHVKSKEQQNAKTIIDVYEQLFEIKAPIEVHSDMVDSLYNDLFSKSIKVTMDSSIDNPILNYLSDIADALVGTLSVAISGGQQFASGTPSAQRGMALVGEKGPELMLMGVEKQFSIPLKQIVYLVVANLPVC